MAVKDNPLFDRFRSQADTEKVIIDSLTIEKSFKMSILRNLLKGVTAKGSGLSDNSGKYVIRLSRDRRKLERYDINSKRKVSKQVMDITKIEFQFEYKDADKNNQIFGATVVIIKFRDETLWELKTPRRNKNTFYSSLIHFRLNNNDFDL